MGRARVSCIFVKMKTALVGQGKDSTLQKAEWQVVLLKKKKREKRVGDVKHCQNKLFSFFFFFFFLCHFYFENKTSREQGKKEKNS